MTVEMDNTDKLKVLFEDAQKMGLTFELPDINRSAYRFEPVTDKVIRYGLGAIKGTGENAINAIVAAREEGGAFTSLFDFCNRVDRTRLNKRTVEALIKGGAFDNLHLNRAALIASIDLAFEFAATQAANANQGGLFDMLDGPGSSTDEPPLVQATPWGIKDRLVQEKTAIGFYLSGHLFDENETEVRRFARLKIDDLIDSRDPQLLAGIVSDFRVINGRSGKLALFKLDDKSGVIEASADEGIWAEQPGLLKDDALVILQAVPRFDRFSGGMRLNVQQIWDLPSARCRFGKYLLAQVALNGSGDGPQLQAVVQQHPPKRQLLDNGDEINRGLPVRLQLLVRGAEGMQPEERLEGQLKLGEASRFYPSDAALAAWMALLPEGKTQVMYE